MDITLCPVCEKRRVTANDSLCRKCRTFVRTYIDTGRIRRQAVPLVGDVVFAMEQLGIKQDRAVVVLGGQP
jgi:hypothetical protein